MVQWIDEYIAAWDAHDSEAVASYMSPDAEYEDLALGQVHRGRDEIAAFVRTSEEFSKDHHFVLVSAQSSGDSYAMEWEMLGTNTGTASGLPPTNQPFRIRGVSIGRLGREGKIVHNRDYWNLADYLMQVGLMPAPAT